MDFESSSEHGSRRRRARLTRRRVAPWSLGLGLLLAGSAPGSALAQSEVGREHQLYRAQLAAAESALRLDEPAVAREWLDATDPARRGFEWRVFDAAMDEALVAWSASASVTALVVAPDGESVLCGTADGKLERRALADGALVWSVEAHASALTDVQLDARGARVVSASFDRTVQVRDAASGALLVRYAGHSNPVGGAAFSPDGELVASCSYERPAGVVGTVHVWRPVPGSGGELVRTLEGGAKPLVGLAFSPDGARIAAGSWHFCVFVWDVAGGAPVELAMPDEGVYNAVDGVSWSADGALVAGSSKDETARVWRISDGALAASLRGHTDAVSKLAFAPSGTTLVTASNDGTLRLWNAEDGTELARLNGHADDVVDVSFAPDGRRIASASSDGTVRVWDVEDPGVFGGLRMRNPAATYVARFSPDDRMLATCSYDGRAQLWCAGTGDLLASWQAHPGDKSCHMLDWTPDGRALATGSYDGTARLWDVATLEELARFDHDGELYWLRSSPDGRRLATCSGKTVVVHDLESGARLHAFEGHSSSVLAVAFSPDSRTCVSTGRDGKALVWDADTGELGYVVERGTDVAEALFTPSGDELVVADRSGRVGLYRASDGGPIRELVRNRHGMDHVDLSPDGARLALASEAVTLVDVEHGGILARFRPHRERPYAVDFDSKGERLASVSTDGTIAILDVRPLRERLVLARDVRARREREGARLSARLDAGAELADLAAEIRDDSTLTAEERSVRIAALLRLAAAHRP